MPANSNTVPAFPFPGLAMDATLVKALEEPRDENRNVMKWTLLSHPKVPLFFQ